MTSKHIIPIGEIRLKCFNLGNYYYASQQLSSGNNKDSSQITQNNPPLLLEIESKLCHVQLTNSLIELSIYFRILEDQLKSENNKDCLDIIAECRNVGNLYRDGKNEISLTLREACNKIIHCTSIEPGSSHKGK